MKKYMTYAAALTAAALSTNAMARDFTGARIEARGGYDTASSEYTVDGFMAGVGAGYDFAISEGLILGIEAGIDFSSAKDSGFVFVAPTSVPYEITAGRDIEVGLRLGGQFGPSTLGYLKAGYTNAGYNAATIGFSNSGTSDGYRAGVGLEQLLSEKVYVKGEYRFSRYGDVDLNRNQFVIGLGFRF